MFEFLKEKAQTALNTADYYTADLFRTYTPLQRAKYLEWKSKFDGKQKLHDVLKEINGGLYYCAKNDMVSNPEMVRTNAEIIEEVADLNCKNIFKLPSSYSHQYDCFKQPIHWQLQDIIHATNYLKNSLWEEQAKTEATKSFEKLIYTHNRVHTFISSNNIPELDHAPYEWFQSDCEHYKCNDGLHPRDHENCPPIGCMGKDYNFNILYGLTGHVDDAGNGLD